MCGVVTGITIVALQPSFCAASATPCAWLPADAAITPRARSRRRQVRHLVVRAAQLEREHRLLVLALQQHAVAEPARQRRRELERRLDRDVVDLRGQDLLQIVDGHGERGEQRAGERSRKARSREPRPRRRASNVASVSATLRPPCARSAHQRPGTLAVVDMGSNSFRLELGRVEGDQIFRLDTWRETLRIGAGIDERGRLTADAQRAALACLARFGERLRGLHPSAVRAVATNTFRVATNAATFLPQAERALGFPIDIITGHEEARLIYIGVAHVLPPSPDAAPRHRHRRRLDRIHHRPRSRARAPRVAEDGLRRDDAALLSRGPSHARLRSPRRRRRARRNRGDRATRSTASTGATRSHRRARRSRSPKSSSRTACRPPASRRTVSRGCASG